MKYSIESIQFQGPLDLLLELVKANKCDIREIFIKNIIDQYLTIIQEEHFRSECEIASDFINTASTLIEIKSRYFIYLNDHLPEEEDPGQELYALLDEYKKIKSLSEMLKEKYEETPVYYTNKGTEILVEETIDFSSFTVIDIFSVYSRYEKQSKKALRSNVVSFKKASVEEKIREIELLLDSVDKIYFNNMVDGKIKDDIVASLLGALELSRMQRVALSQYKIFDNILIERT